MSDSNPFPISSDQVQDYATGHGGYGSPVSMAGQQNEEFPQDGQFVQNDQLLQSDQFMQNDVPNESDGGTNNVENNLLWPVLPGDSGEGLPYAPIDWPYPGDVWTWRVGRRFNSSGYFQDRFLYLPKSLGKQTFASKAAVANYIQSQFPGSDIDAFFASFAWKIPVKIQPPPKEEPAISVLENALQDEKVAGQEEKKEENLHSGLGKRRRNAVSTPKQATQNGATSSSTPKRTKQSRAKSSPAPKGTKNKLSPTPKRTRQTKQTNQNGTAPSSTAKRKTRHSSRRNVPSDKGGVFITEESAVEPIPEDFDNYLNSLEDILTQPVSGNLSSASMDSYTAQNEMAEARSKLSSLLVMDFPSLVLSNKISELANLASKLRKDPTLNAEQLVKLKLIEEISSFTEVFLESRELIEQVDDFFATLEAKKAKVASLKKEYNELKEKTDQLQAQVDSNLMTVQEIDNQIALLQSRRAELTNAIETNKEAKVEVVYAQKLVANAIPKVVNEIQLANSRIPELELKKTNAVKRESEILAKFAPLQGFSL
uniref:DUF7081 domain-containing protein n=1 Tax=Manihot esculenta TaxID=3983 RepID=A0A2C9W8H1_MANES